MRLHYIYVIESSLSDWVYVGKTVNLKGRWKGHRGDAKRGDDRHLYRAIRKYGVESFKMSPVAAALTADAAYETERVVIAQYKAEGISLYNCNNGGKANCLDIPTQETCQMISARLKEVWSDEEKRKQLGETVRLALSEQSVKDRLGHKGVDHSLSKLSDADVLAMREAYNMHGINAPTLARQYNVCRNVAWRVVTGSSWKHLPMPELRKPPRLRSKK